ncbi:MAG: signal recognition particle protein [Armatimonadetes bacterium]|nr:signal recognition particle protein [Armatimonadota bacterium]
MFESLSDKLTSVFKRLRSRGRLTEKDVTDALREVRLALLEADVHFKVVKDFIAVVKERCIGADVLESLGAVETVVKIVHEELTKLLQGDGTLPDTLQTSPKGISVYLMVGLQGSGKTTTASKIAAWSRKKGNRPLLVACDVYRPAAIQQLETLGRQLNIPVFSLGDQVDPVDIAIKSLDEAKAHGNDLVIIDTAGRLHIDEPLIREVQRIHEELEPVEILLVVDAMTGQDAVNVAQAFHEALPITGLVMTKLDGDARGGAAISMRAVTGVPIKLMGLGEKMDALEPFHPERMAGRILGMGDVLSLIERVEGEIDERKALEMEKKLREARFDFEDYLDQLQQVRRLGPLDQVMKMIPGMGAQMRGVEVDESQLGRVEAIIRSMTLQERRHPEILNGSRKRRIAMGSGTSVEEVNRLIKQFEEMRRMIKGFVGMDKMMKGKKRGRGLHMPFRKN